MAGGQGKRKKKQKRRKQRADDVAPAALRVDVHLDLAIPAPWVAGPGWRPAEAETPSRPLADTPGGVTIPPERAPATPDPSLPAVVGGPSWPMGPHYLRWVEGKGADAWARFKLKAGDWYLGVLEDAEAEIGLDRYVGVEMAIDGVLASLLAGVDAAGHALLDELGRFAGPARHERHLDDGDWSAALDVAEGLGVALACRGAVEKALRGDDGEGRDGWLTELRRLQALAVRRNVLVRRPSVDGDARNRLLDVPGRGQRPVLRYLGRARQRAGALVEAMLTDVEGLGEERLRPAPQGGGALPNLAARAGVIQRPWRTPGAR